MSNYKMYVQNGQVKIQIFQVQDFGFLQHKDSRNIIPDSVHNSRTHVKNNIMKI